MTEGEKLGLYVCSGHPCRYLTSEWYLKPRGCSRTCFSPKPTRDTKAQKPQKTEKVHTALAVRQCDNNNKKKKKRRQDDYEDKKK